MTLGLLLATLLGTPIAQSDATVANVRVTAEPNNVVLRSGDAPIVRIVALVNDADGAPAQGAQVLGDTTAGTLAAFAEVSPGVYEAALARPVQNFPQVAVVTVFVQPAAAHVPPRVGTAVVPFAAEINLRGVTEPGASMRVEVGGRTFGPTEVDPNGRFALPVVVPPGAESARGISTDALGNASESAINLYLPALDRLHSFVYPRAPVADGVTQAWIYATSLSKSGAPQPGAVNAGQARGTLAVGEALGVGLWRFAYTPPTVVAPGFDLVHFGGALEADEKIPLSAGPPARLALLLDPNVVPADGHASASIALVVNDAHGNPTDAPQVRIEVDGAPLDVDHPEVGRFTAVLPARRRIGESRVVATVWRPNQTPLAPVQAALVWRMPTPVTLALSVMERSPAGWVLHVDAGSDGQVAARLVWQASHGAVTQLANGDWLLSVDADSVAALAGAPIDVVARDTLTSVSAWLRIAVTP